ncbi:MAG TPA: hydroxyacylglutathione hydrolase [Candidatus Saccharimonadia bacterium]|nr:hydroxyacylglutathione hydrolase [Candidatus Saccharimonadia bacterium]
MHVFPIPAFADNYIWLLEAAGAAVVVDPGDAAPVEHELARRGLRLHAILLTHHHADHVGGAAALAARHACAVHAPIDGRITATTHPVGAGDRITLPMPGLELTVHAVPGHTLTHVAFEGSGLLFCGDTLFAAGCGRLFEGTPAQMLASLESLAALPEATAVHCGHEYTLANLAFARVVEPHSESIAARIVRERAVRACGAPTLPSSIGLERATNPFLRCGVATVRDAAERHCGSALAAAVDVFGALRRWKDDFRGVA